MAMPDDADFDLDEWAACSLVYPSWVDVGVIRHLVGSRGGDGLSVERLVSSIGANPVAFGLAFICAVSFSLYCNITRRYAGAGNQIVFFFILSSCALWVKYAISDEQLHGLSILSGLELFAAAFAVAGGYGL